MKKLLFRILFVTVSSFALGMLLLWIVRSNSSAARTLEGAMPDTYEFMYMRRFYSWYNKIEGKKVLEDYDKILLVDLTKPEQLPEMIRIIGAHNPKVIGLDILLTGTYNDTLKQQIKASMESVKDKLISVCDGYHGQRNCSFFVKEGDGFTLASSSIPKDFWHYSYLDESTCVEKDGQIIPPVPCFPWAIVDKYFSDSNDYRNEINESVLVNYKITSFKKTEYFRIIDMDKYDDNIIFKDKIVIIGDLSDINDKHSVPFQNEDISGTELHAYAVKSALDDSFFKKLGVKANFFLNLVIVLLYSALYVIYIKTVEETWKNKKTSWLPVTLRPIIIFSFVALMYLVSFILVGKCHFRIPEISLATVSIAIIDFMDRIYNTFNIDSK